MIAFYEGDGMLTKRFLVNVCDVESASFVPLGGGALHVKLYMKSGSFETDVVPLVSGYEFADEMERIMKRCKNDVNTDGILLM
ncbi:MAG: hypothetical protein PHN45_00030 [Methylococcales bacterium]|nr:hypothetical protein [Methylococcales bacterium]